jgi:hypothetical protein
VLLLHHKNGSWTFHPGTNGTQTMVTAEKLHLSAQGFITASIALSGRPEISHLQERIKANIPHNFCPE